jgi:hypothetical protein
MGALDAISSAQGSGFSTKFPLHFRRSAMWWFAKLQLDLTLPCSIALGAWLEDVTLLVPLPPGSRPAVGAVQFSVLQSAARSDSPAWRDLPSHVAFGEMAVNLAIRPIIANQPHHVKKNLR